MPKDSWLPIGFEYPTGEFCRVHLYGNENWQIYKTGQGNNALVVKPEFAYKWIEAGLIEKNVFSSFKFSNDKYYAFFSPDRYELAPIAMTKSPASKADAMSFAASLRETRKIEEDVSLHDSIFVEKLTRLLPTWTISPNVPDDIVLGTWLTGGVQVSIMSSRRLSSLTGWLPHEHLLDVLDTAGYDITNSVNKSVYVPKSNDLSKAKRKHRIKSVIQSDEIVRDQNQFSLPGRPKLEAFFNEHVIDIIFNADKYKTLGISFPSSIVLHGPPGCGKTFAVDCLLEFIDWPNFSIDSNTIGSPYIHATSKKISEVFDKAIDAAPSVVTIDEMDSFLSDRQNIASSGTHHVEEVAEFLRRIPEAGENKVLIIGMTNRIDAIDPAILRRGRFDHIIEVGMPSHEEVKSLIESLISKIPTSDDINTSSLVDELTERPLSDCSFVIREAARLSAKSGKTVVDEDSLNKALESLPSKEVQKLKQRQIGFMGS
jgi:hypothetical protein